MKSGSGAGICIDGIASFLDVPCQTITFGASISVGSILVPEKQIPQQQKIEDNKQLQSDKKYKIVLWINNDVKLPEKFLGRDDVLIVGSGDRYLKYSELSLTPLQKSGIHSNTQLIFYSHGIKSELLDSCSYKLENSEGKNEYRCSVSVIGKILGNGKNIHMISCYAGVGYRIWSETVNKPCANLYDLGISIFFHGGNEATRGHKSYSILNQIDQAKLVDDPIQNQFNLLKSFYEEAPGDFGFIQMPTTLNKTPLCLFSNFVNENLKNTKSYIIEEWQRCVGLVRQFANANGLKIKIDDTIKIDAYNYLYNGLLNGSDIFYQLNLNLAFASIGTKAIKQVDDKNVDKFVQDLYSLVEQKVLTIEQYDDLIVSVYRSAVTATHKPKDMEFQLTSSHKKLFQKGLDVAKAKELVFFMGFFENLLEILKLDEIKCSQIDYKGNHILKTILAFTDAKHLNLWSLMLHKLDSIDLMTQVDHLGVSKPLISTLYISTTELFKNHPELIKLLLSKSLPVAPEELVKYGLISQDEYLNSEQIAEKAIYDLMAKAQVELMAEEFGEQI